MASNTDFSALRLRKENIAVFQDLKLAYESRHFIRLSNDDFFSVLKDLALSSSPELGEDYSRVLTGRAPAPADEVVEPSAAEAASEDDLSSDIA